jgi:hypothetical protein
MILSWKSLQNQEKIEIESDYIGFYATGNIRSAIITRSNKINSHRENEKLIG